MKNGTCSESIGATARLQRGPFSGGHDYASFVGVIVAPATIVTPFRSSRGITEPRAGGSRPRSLLEWGLRP